MHELGITKAIIEMAIREANKNNVSSIKKIFVELGKLNSYKKEPIEMYFNSIKKNYGLKNSRIYIREIPGKVICNSCKKESEVNEPYLISCQFCESFDTKIIQGKECNLIRIVGE